MATLIANADGNLTGAATFAATETGTGALALVRNSTSNFSQAASFTSSAFTVTSGKVIDAVLLWLFVATVGPTGTFKVDLQKGGVSQASVTVNKTDLPDSTNLSPVPVLFKLGSTATGDGGSNWTIVITTTGTSAVTYQKNSSTLADVTRALRTTTAATAGAGSDLYVVGELTGAGTHNSRAVTMDSTAATAYGNGAVNTTTVNGGGIHVSNYGSLSYGTVSATNYVLRVAGDLIVYQYGTLNIGASGAEVPRNGSAVLEFQQVSVSADFGLIARNNAVVNIAGLSRTTGKDIYQCKLTADVSSTNTISGGTGLVAAGTVSTTVTDPQGGFATVTGFTDTTASTNHLVEYSGSAVTNVVQTAEIWLARGTGTHNRYARLTVGNTSSFSSVVDGFYVDIDLQLGTVGTPTVIGGGTATSASIVACNGGFVVKLTGKIRTAAVAGPGLFIQACSAAGTLSYAGDATQNFIYAHVSLVNASSLPDTTLNVDADTGWLSGDVVCVAATTRTASQSASYPLNADAGASSLVSAVYPGGLDGTPGAFTYSGTTPTQAEIGLLTRNVRVRSTSSILWSYVYCEPLATVNASRAEFYFLGLSGTTNKRGIETRDGAVTSPRSFTYCSMHDCVDGLYCNTGSLASLGVTFSHNVVWNTSSVGVNISASSGPDWTFDSNLIMKCLGSAGIVLGSVEGRCTNNVIACNTSIGFILNDRNNHVGTIDGNVTHSNANIGLEINLGCFGVVSNHVSWRNSLYGVQYNIPGSTADLELRDITVFGNHGTYNVMLSTIDSVRITGDSVIAGDTSFPVTNGIVFSTSTLHEIDLSGIDMSGVGGIYAPHTGQDLYFGFAGAYNVPKGVIRNCKFGSPSPPIPLSQKPFWGKDAYVSFERYNQTAGDHRTEMTYGTLQTDSTIYNVAAPSMRMTPSDASNKLESAPRDKGILAPVASGDSVTVSVHVRKALGSDTGTGSFNPSDKTSNIALSGSNLTATATSTAIQQAVRSTTSRLGGKWYVEFIIGATAPTAGTLGSTTSSTTLAGLASANTGFEYAFADGNLYTTSGLVAGKNIGTPVAGDVVDMALDLTNHLGWFRRNGGNWNNDPAADPTTGTGGINLSLIFSATVAAYFHFATSSTNGASCTVNVGGSAFTYSAPSGFEAWDTGALYQGSQPRLVQRANAALGQSDDVVLATASGAVGAWEQLSATSSVPTDDGAFELVVDCDGTSGWINVDDWDAVA